MAIRTVAVLASTLVCLGACAAPGGSYQSSQNYPSNPFQSFDDANAEQRRELSTGLTAYATSPACEGTEYSQVIKSTALLEVGIDTNELELLRRFRQNRQTAGDGLNKLAEEAMVKKCKATARKVYLDVVETFTGNVYASIRQRAQIGLDDVRAMPDAATPSRKTKTQ